MKSLLLFFLLSAPAYASGFLPERGDYRFTMTDVAQRVTGPYLIFNAEKSIAGAKYRFNSDRNDYQIKDWFLRDWFQMQKMFTLDVEAFIAAESAQSFNQAKRRQYRRFPFDKKKFFHRKSVPGLKEWGGLTHPPFHEIKGDLARFHAGFARLDYATLQSPYFDPSLQRQVDEASRSELSFDNQVEALEDQDAWYAKKWLISKARVSITMSSLVFVCDKSTKEVVDLLIGKHREGVKVRVIVDSMISKLLKHTACPDLMRKAGIEVIYYKEFFRHELKAIYHTKTLVVDDAEAIAGGQNMIDADNTSRGTDFKNRDIDLYVRGPMVKDISRQFMENWNYHLKAHGNEKGRLSSMDEDLEVLKAEIAAERRLGLRGSEHYARLLADPATRMRGVCRFIKQAPHEDRHTVGKAYLKLLDKVRRHLLITDPIKADTASYRASDRPLIDKLDNFDMFNLLHERIQRLAKDGLPVDYITTNVDMAGNENVAMMEERIKEQLERGQEFRANWSYLKLLASNKYYAKDHYRNLLKDWAPIPSVNVWNHIAFLHSKIFYFDRTVVSVGSVNFQHNATDQAYESTAICMDEHLNRQMDRILVQDMANSIPLIFSKLQ